MADRKNVYLPQLDNIERAILMAHTGGADATTLDAMFTALVNGENTTALFRQWWPLARAQDELSTDEKKSNRYHTLRRWFKIIGDAWSDKVYTLRWPYYTTTGDNTMTPLADLAKKSGPAQLCDKDTLPEDDWADEDPMTWYIRATVAKHDENGDPDVVAVEIEDSFDDSGENGMVMVFRKTLWRLWFEDGSYEYKTYKTARDSGLVPQAAGINLDGTARECTWQPAYGGGLDSQGRLTSGTKSKPNWMTSMSAGLTAARKRSAYEGLITDPDVDVMIDQWQIKHWTLTADGQAEGCSSYNHQFQVAMAEEGTKRVLLTAAQAANLIEGSMVAIGTHGEDATGVDRASAYMRDIVPYAKIKSIGGATVEGTEYAEVRLDITDGVDIPATAYLSTMPWQPGETNKIPGRKDGCPHGLTNGKSPLRVGGCEAIDGAYAIGGDPIWQTTWNEDAGTWQMDIYQCREARKQATSTGNYTKMEHSLRLENNPAQGWHYIRHMWINSEGILVPDAVDGGAGSANYYRAALTVYRSSGVRVPWRFALLSDAGSCGLVAAHSRHTPSNAYWHGRPRPSGSGGTRGEWAA